jgi:uncharacterized 2Fe-2S/4Fe-4S cluster protein (DUF4445 family)
MTEAAARHPQAERRTVVFQPSGRRGLVAVGSTVRQAATALGVPLEGSCGDNATCGKCRVELRQNGADYGLNDTSGSLSPLSAAEESLLKTDDIARGLRLACQARILGDAVIFVPPESRPGARVVGKEAGELRCNISPAVSKYYIEMAPPGLADDTSDTERLLAALEEQHGLTGLDIDFRVLRRLPEMARQCRWRLTVGVWQGSEVIMLEPGQSPDVTGWRWI